MEAAKETKLGTIWNEDDARTSSTRIAQSAAQLNWFVQEHVVGKLQKHYEEDIMIISWYYQIPYNIIGLYTAASSA